MIFRFILSNPYFTVVFNAILAIVLIIGNVGVKSIDSYIEGYFLYQLFFSKISLIPEISLITNLVLVLFISIMIEWLMIRSNLSKEVSYVTSLFSILFLLGNPQYQFLNPQTLSLLILLLAMIQIVSIYNTDDALKDAFNSGLLVAIASLIYFPNIIFIFFVLYAFINLKKVSAREMLIVLVGGVLPYMYAYSYLFLFDKNTALLIPKIEFIHPQLPEYVSEYLLILLIIIWVFISIFNTYNQNSSSLGIKQKKVLNLSLGFTFFVIISAVFSGNYSFIHLGSLVVPFAIFSGLNFKTKNTSKSKILLVLLLFVLVSLLQIEYHWLSKIDIKFIR